MKKGSGTRSGLLWEVERILNELKEIDALPQCLLMENVCQVHGAANWQDFEDWKKALKNLGYSNFWKDLIATDYGVPQTRDRTFMVSILGEWNYEFPKPRKLEKRLRDLLEDDVPEKYFLSDKQIEQISNWNAYEKPFETMERAERERVSPTLTTRTGAFAAGMILVKDIPNEKVETIGNYSPSGHNASRIVDTGGAAPTVMENHGTVTAIAIKNATKKGYLLAEEGDGVDISTRIDSHRGTVQKGKAQTITTMGGVNNGVIVKAKS